MLPKYKLERMRQGALKLLSMSSTMAKEGRNIDTLLIDDLCRQILLLTQEALDTRLLKEKRNDY